MMNFIALVVAIVMAVWVYQVVNKRGGRLPWLWAIGALVFWPIVASIAGFKYEEVAMMVVGVVGLLGIVVGTVLSIGLVAFL